MTFHAFQVLCLALAENNFIASDSGWEEGLNHSCEPVHKGAMQVERPRGAAVVWVARMSGRLRRGGLGLGGGEHGGLAQPGGMERLVGWEDVQLEGLEFDHTRVHAGEWCAWLTH